jgi:hypothetical protein
MYTRLFAAAAVAALFSASAATAADPDVTPPETTITAGPTGVTTQNPPGFSFESNETGVTFTCRFDTAPFAACGSLEKLSQGAHTFSVRATDPSGNIDGTPATRSFTIDSVAPAIGIARTTRQVSARHRFTIVIKCPAGEPGGCQGSMRVRSVKKLRRTPRSKAGIVTFSKTQFHIGAGARVPILLSLSKRNVALLKRLGKVRVAVAATVKDSHGNRHTSTARLTLKAPSSNL